MFASTWHVDFFGVVTGKQGLWIRFRYFVLSLVTGFKI